MRTQEVLIVVRRGEDFLVVHRSPENDAYWHQIAGGVEQMLKLQLQIAIGFQHMPAKIGKRRAATPVPSPASPDVHSPWLPPPRSSGVIPANKSVD